MFRRRILFHKRRRHRRTCSLTPHYRQYRTVAETVIRHKVEQWSYILRLDYNRVTIRNQKSRWGSCSQSKNLNFNYKLIFLPEHLLDYVIVHELCHLRELNHSRNFWSLVEGVLPEYKAHKKQLREYESRLTLDPVFLEQYRSIIDVEP